MATFRRRPPREDVFHLVVSGRFVSTHDGGRQGPVASDYRPNCWFGAEIGGVRLYHDVVLYFHEDQDAREDQGTLWVAPGGSFRADAFPMNACFLRPLIKRGMSFEICEGARVVGTATVDDIVDPRPQRDQLLFNSRRYFQLWHAGVGHQTLLLRSTKEHDDSDTKTRIDLLFKPVRGMKLRTLLHGLRVTELADPAAGPIRAELGDTGNHSNERIYRLESPGFEGWIVAGVMAARQDDLAFHEPSGFSILPGRLVEPPDENLPTE